MPLARLNLYGDIPILKLGMTHPIDVDIVREFAEQVDEIYVVEEKRPLLENEIKAFLTQMYQEGNIKQYVNVWGKQFPDGFGGDSGSVRIGHLYSHSETHSAF